MQLALNARKVCASDAFAVPTRPLIFNVHTATIVNLDSGAALHFIIRSCPSQYDLAVTVHHDNESASSASRYDVYQPQRPFVSLDHFIDGAPMGSGCVRMNHLHALHL